jgi:hypothetical protein
MMLQISPEVWVNTDRIRYTSKKGDGRIMVAIEGGQYFTVDSEFEKSFLEWQKNPRSQVTVS